MPKKTLALIAGLVLVTVILFIIALRTGQQTKKGPEKQPTAQQAADQAHTTLMMSPNPVEVGSGQQGTVEVLIDTSDNPVTAVQLEVQYDPKMVTNLKATPGPMFANPGLSFPKNDVKTGHMTYMLGIQPGQKPVNGQGVAVVLTFTAVGTVGQQSQLTLLPKSLASARGVATSVLKMASGTTVTIGAGGEAAGTTTQTVTQPQPTTPAQ